MSHTNPETGRKVKQNTRTFIKLLTKYDFDQIKGFTPKVKVNKYYRDPSGFLITENMAKKWMKRNKTYKMENNAIKFITGVKYRNLESVYNDLPVYKSVKVELNDGYFKFYNFQSSIRQKMFKELYVTFYEEINNNEIVEFTFYEKNINSDPFTIAHNSAQSNCFMELVKEKKLKLSKALTREQEELYKELQEGVMPQDLENISKTFKLNIYINIYGETIKNINNKDKNCDLRMFYDNFHVSKKSQRKNQNEKELVTFSKLECRCGINNLSLEEEVHIVECNCDPLQKAFNEAKNEDIHNVVLSNELLSFSTATHTYKNHSFTCEDGTIFNFDKHDYNLSSLFRKNLHKYVEGTMPRPLFDFKHDEHLTRAINFNFSDINSRITYKEIDIKSAYDPQPNKEYPSNLDIRITTNKMLPNIGFYLITVKDPIFNAKISQIYSTDELLVFNKHNIKYVIQEAYLSSSTFKVLNSWRDMKKYESRIFQFWLGYIQRKYQSESITTSDIEVAKKHGAKEIRYGLFQFETGDRKQTKSYMPHVAGYIQAYTRSKLYDYLLSNTSVKPIRIWTDNIVVENNKSIPLNDYFKAIFKEGSKKYKEDKPKSEIKEHIENIEPIGLPNISHKLLSTDSNHTLYLNGFAGTGKTYTINELIKLMKVTGFSYKVFSPTYNTAKLINGEVIQKFENKPYYLYNDVIIIDEASMITQKQLNCVKFYSNALIILSGDHERQLLSIENDDIDFDSITTIKLTECKRAEDKEFVSKLLHISDTNASCITQFKKIEEKKINYSNYNQVIVCATKEEVKTYNRSFYDKSQETCITDTIKLHMPVIVNNNKLRQKSDGMLYNGVKGVFTSAEVSNKKYYKLELEDGTHGFLTKDKIITANIQPALAITYHKSQGQTFDEKYNVILSRKGLSFFDYDTQRRMVYVGASRVKKENQLYYL